ncbi:hypothetical protein OCS_05955 [Ophiocordyceps sinensis CO18]|uniref:25S rRNA (uridine-N(3))-methyltransferase BMT5-like domain-containing protein n=1 Tax=Ophiocordyceps sinensis (strain Co18 / CGMCC 3.14243) TaxID=911162 RepID=T5A9B3_OPHSC|nr:hypothetical protein OCS_05955 [Ophiocordyceps sinensis CO18]
MGKRRRLQNKAVRPRKPPGTAAKPKNKQPRQQHKQQELPVIPFGPADRILLVGEGDLSFAASAIKHHGCVNVTATVLEKDHAELVQKYPDVDANIAVILSVGDGEEDGEQGKGGVVEDEHAQGSAGGSHDESDDLSGSDAYNSDDGDAPRPRRPSHGPRKNKLFYNIDAAKGEAGGGWRGEHRPARSYVFRRKGEVEAQPVSGKKRARGRDDDSSDEDEDD